jgi:hypothetical protein
MKEVLHREGDKIIHETLYDNSAVMEHNKAMRNSANEFGRYKSGNSQLVNIGKIHEGDVVRLHNMGYKLLSADKDEVKRALLYIQSNEPDLLVVPGKPISKKRMIWA